MYDTMQKRVFDILEAHQEGDRVSKYVDLFLVILILLNIFVLVIETVPAINQFSPEMFRYFEIVSIIIFSTEYLLRVWSCGISHEYTHGLRGRLQFMRSPFSLIDLTAIIPFFLPFFGFDFRFLRAFRLLRLVKIGRYSKSVLLFKQALSSKKDELMVSCFLIIVSMIFSSCLIYFIEHDAQPTVFSSIPACMWWAVVTLTTVGYGDMSPITPLGKLVAGFIALGGIGLFTVPTAIIASAFVEQQDLRTNFGSGLVWDDAKKTYARIKDNQSEEG